MIENKQIENELADEESSNWIWSTAVGTGLLFWASLFGLIFFCIRA